MERRSFNWDDLEIRQDEGGEPVLRGYVARFNEPSEDLGGFIEKIQRGAFRKTISDGADVRFLLNHDPNIVLGRSRAGTLYIRERSGGLWIENTLPDTQQALDITVSVKRGDITQGSFGFRTVKDKWDDNAEPIVRTLVEVQLFDASLVTFPAYPSTSISARFSTVAAALATAGDGGELNRAELRALQTHIEQTRQYLPAEPLEDEHSTDDAESTFQMKSRSRQRRLELAAL